MTTKANSGDAGSSESQDASSRGAEQVPEQAGTGDGQAAEPDQSSEADQASQPDQASEPHQASENETGGKASRRPLWRRPLFLILLACLIAAVVAGVVYYIVKVAPFESTDDAFIDADIVQIAPQISGKVIEVRVGNNTAVNTGDLLLVIDPASAEAALETAKGQLAEAEAERQQAEAGTEQARQQAAEAQATFEAADVKARNARENFERDQKLFQSNSSAISQMAVDDSESLALQAEAQAKASRQAVLTAKANVGVAEAKTAAAEAAIKAAQAQVDAAQVDLDHTTILASEPGTIVQNTVGVGTYASAGTPLMALVPNDIFVTANFKETQLADIRTGQDVDITVDAYPDVGFKGKVLSIQKGAGQAFQLLPPQNATGNFVKVVQRVPVRISIVNPDPDRYILGPGMSVVPRIRVD